SITYRIIQPFGIDFAVGTFQPFCPSLNYIIGLNVYLGRSWAADVIFSAHFGVVRFGGNNDWQIYSLGIGNSDLRSNFYWRVGIFYYKYVNSDKYNSLN